MTTFKKYMAAKTKVNEKMLPKTMNQNYFIRKELNEYDGEASTKGGEIDAIVFGALAIMGRAMKNAMTYAKLKSLKGPYLEQYELCGSNSSRTVFDEENQGKAIDEIKDREIALKDQKEKVADEIKKKKDSLPDGMPQEVKNKKTDAIDKQKDIADAKIDNEIEKLKTTKAKVKDAADNKWDQEKRKLDALADKITKAEEGFVMGGSFKEKWTNELKQAKLDIDEAVTQKAREIVTAKGDKDAAKEFDAKLARLKERAAEAEAQAAEAELDDDEASATDAIEKIPSLPAYQQAKEDLDSFCSELDKAYRPEAEKEKEKPAEKPTETPAEGESGKKEKTQESVTEKEESSAPKAPSPSEVIALMSKAYENQPDEAKADFASKVISNIEKLRDLKVKIAEVRLKAAEECEKVASDENSKLPSAIKKAFLQDDKVPDNFKEDVKEAGNSYKEELESWKEKAGGKGKETSDNEEGKPSDSEEGDNNEKPTEEEKEKAKQLIKKSEEEEEKHQKEVVEPIKDDLEKEKAKDPKDEKKIADLEELVASNEIQTLQLKLTTARLKAEAEGKNKNEDDTYKSIMKQLVDKKEELDAKKSQQETKNKEEDSTEKKESVSTNIPKKFMKFEDYLAMKEKNK